MAPSITISGIAAQAPTAPAQAQTSSPSHLAAPSLTALIPVTTTIPLGSPGLVLTLEESNDGGGLPYAEMRLAEWEEILAFGSGGNRHQALLDLLISLSMAEARLVEEARETLEALAHNAVECILRGCAGESPSDTAEGEAAR